MSSIRQGAIVPLICLPDLLCKLFGPTVPQLLRRSRMPLRRQRTEIVEYPDPARASRVQDDRNFLGALSFGKTII